MKHLTNTVDRLVRKMALHRTAVVWSINAFLAGFSYYLAYAARFDAILFSPSMNRVFLITLPLSILLKLFLLLHFKVFSGLWRYVSARDLVQMSKALTLYSVCFTAVTLLAMGHSIPRSVYLLDLLSSLMLFGGLRLSIRFWRELTAQSSGTGPERRFLIIGAGDMGEMAARSLINQVGGNNRIIGYMDDNPMKKDRLLHGYPVLGNRNEIHEICLDNGITDILFAISEPPKELAEFILDQCKGLTVSFRILPALHDLATGKVDVQRIRNIEIEDLLGRPPIQLDQSIVHNEILQKKVMVTGAGGSIGSELARQIARYNPSELTLLDTAETPLFEIQQELKKIAPHLSTHALLCNIKSQNAVNAAMQQATPDFVFHAAAYKHVPMLEEHPDQAILNNICGTMYLAEAACQCNVKKFIMISTDKAVCPSSIMGASKRIGEIYISSLADQATLFTAVRFGNVLGSNGSVIPIFRKQIAQGGPVTVTHPEMTRFFMTIREAAQLVLQCSTFNDRHRIYVLDMGRPVRILDLARDMIRLSGLEPQRDITISITGLRPGEKMHESLFSEKEQLRPSPVPKVNFLENQSSHETQKHINTSIQSLYELAIKASAEEIKAAIWSLIEKDSKSS